MPNLLTFTRIMGPDKKVHRCLLSSMDFDRIIYLTRTRINGDVYIGWDDDKLESYLLFNQ